MKFIHYISSSIVDSYDIIIEQQEFVVYFDSGNYYFASQINDNVYAVFLWDDYSLLQENNILSTAKLQVSESKLIYQETLQVVFDKFPKTIKNEVCVLALTHHSNVSYNVNLLYYKTTRILF